MANCRKCGVILTEYNSYQSYIRKRDYICKSCKNKTIVPEKNRKKVREWRKKNPEKHRLQWLRATVKAKEDALTHYSNGKPRCVCCSEDTIDFLTLDHINGRKIVAHKRSLCGKTLYKLVKRQGYPEGYQVLCMNCKFAKGHLGYCPHQKREVVVTH